jgi:zeaxanthin glucosyltransferase
MTRLARSGVEWGSLLELLKRAELCITNARINTTLESLALGVPIVAIPVGFDQPRIAARIVYHGLGKSVPVASMNKEDLSGAIQEVLGNPATGTQRTGSRERLPRPKG